MKLNAKTQVRANFDELCREPSFDAVVAISEDHLLLFKNNFIWLLNLVTYQLGFPFYFDKTFGNCSASEYDPRQYGRAMLPMPRTTIAPSIDSVPQSLLEHDYYVWNVHDNLTQYFNHICINMVCFCCFLQLSVFI